MAVKDPTGRRRGARPWVALGLPAAAWVLFEYGLGTGLGIACHAAGRAGIGWGIASLLACGGAAGLAWPMARGGGGGDPPARPWLAQLALVGAGVFALAILLQTLATAIVPPCAR